MTIEEFVQHCLKIKNGDISLAIPCCANCKNYTKVSLTDLTYYECDHPLMDSDDPYVGVALVMNSDDFCSRWEDKNVDRPDT